MKKILIVTYYWPPRGGGGVQRWLKFSKYLPEFGWDPVIYTPSNPDFKLQDTSLSKDISPQIEVIKKPIREPYALMDTFTAETRTQGILPNEKRSGLLNPLTRWARGNLFIPDPKKSWIKPSIRFLKKYISQEAINYVVTTGPPHSMHLIGLGLKRSLGVTWIADFRDPWSRWDMLKEFRLTQRSMDRHKQMEADVVKSADVVLSVSPNWSKEMNEDHNKEIHIITNGFDSTDFTGYELKQNNMFTIGHSGLLNEFRNPVAMWEVLTEMCHENADFGRDLRIKLSGMVAESCINYLDNNKYLKDKYTFSGYISHEEVLKSYSEIFVNLLLVNNTSNAKGHLPAKLFEYLAAGKYILGLGPENGDAAEIIRYTKTGNFCAPHAKTCIKNNLYEFFRRFQKGEHPKPENLEIYERKILTHQLVDLLETA